MEEEPEDVEAGKPVSGAEGGEQLGACKDGVG
jgi:hypothetical protein